MKKIDIILKACEDKIGEDIKLINLENNIICDSFVIVTGSNYNHTRAIANEIEEKLRKEGYETKIEGFRDGNWILLDAGDVIVHIFTKNTRDFYKLEKLWENWLIALGLINKTNGEFISWGDLWGSILIRFL